MSTTCRGMGYIVLLSLRLYASFTSYEIQRCVVVVLTLTRIVKSVVAGQAPVTLVLRNTPGKKRRTNQRWFAHIS